MEERMGGGGSIFLAQHGDLERSKEGLEGP